MIYLWELPENYKNRDMGEYNREVSPDQYLLSEGRALAPQEFARTPEVLFEISKERVLQFDCLPNNSLVPLVNARVKALLEVIAPNDVAFIKAKLVCNDGVLDNYYFLNVTHTVIGIDHEKSVCVKIKVDGTEFINGFHYLTYVPGCMGEHQLARDEEYKGNLLVHENVKLVFDKEKITGVWLVRPEDYYRPLSELL